MIRSVCQDIGHRGVLTRLVQMRHGEWKATLRRCPKGGRKQEVKSICSPRLIGNDRPKWGPVPFKRSTTLMKETVPNWSKHRPHRLLHTEGFDRKPLPPSSLRRGLFLCPLIASRALTYAPSQAADPECMLVLIHLRQRSQRHIFLKRQQARRSPHEHYEVALEYSPQTLRRLCKPRN